ncbi:MAG TPA: hypothetical protein VE087_07560 [Xanthobacteraceae bacterium]|nr:hypothetical protein [Xanthobacteraceae bacterium]
MKQSIGAAAWLLLLPAAAQAMSVEQFLTKAHALQAGGPAAAASPDLALVRDEIKSSAVAYRADIEADRAAGKPPRSCPPPRGQAKIDSKTLVASFETIPAANRDMSVKTAFYAFMDKRYSCR